MKNSFAYTVVFTFVLSFLFVLILSFTNAFTIDKIHENTRIAKQTAILKALGIQNVDSIAQIEKQFANVEETVLNGNTYYKTNLNGTPIYASAYIGPGLWGSISGYISMDEQVQHLMGFEVVDQNETPGLGGRINEEWFLQQFKNEAIVNNNVLVSKKGAGDTDKENGIIDGITGATRTSDGIQAIITNSIAQFKKDLGK